MSSCDSFPNVSDYVEKLKEYSELESEEVKTKRYKWPGQRNQCYEGYTLYDNLHGSGTYFIDDGYCIYYNGLFYANKLEGYCQVFYSESTTHFQGLFKNNRRFGPGVLTYSDGRQDVGIWDGYSLIRTGEVYHSHVSSLANTNTGYLRLLKFRNLVDVSSEDLADVAKEMLVCLGATDSVLNKSDQLYNINVRNRNNLFFPKPIYDKNYARASCMIDILLDGSDCNMLIGRPKTEEDKLEVTKIKTKVEIFNKRLEKLKRQLRNIKIDKEKIQKNLDFCTKCCLVVDQCPLPNDDAVASFITSTATDGQQKSKVDFFLSASSLNFGDFSFKSSTSGKSVDVDLNMKDESEFNSNSDSCTCMGEMEIEDIVALENKLDYLSNKCDFYSIIVAQLSEKRENLLDQLKIRETFNSKKVTPTDVLAWNNEPTVMKIMKHSFLFRKTEYMVNFSIADVVSGLRQGFGLTGDTETACSEFFTGCTVGDNVSVIRHLKKPYFNVNVTDALGNAGIFFAASNNRWDTIRILAEFGANTNQINDECLTPLSLSIICYLGEKYRIDNYEEAFIPKINISEEDADDAKCWYPSRSLLDIVNTRRSSVRFVTTKKPKTVQKMSDLDMARNSCFIFSTSYPNFTVKPVKEASTGSLIKLNDSDCLPNALKVIEETIATLLAYGAKPYIGKCPIPGFLMTLYTENANIVRMFLEYGADVNVVTHDEQLNALHIMSSAECIEENIKICKLLVEYNCNPNVKAQHSHWREIKEKLLTFVGTEYYEDVEKNPLHTLCLRTDFQSDNCRYFETITKLLIEAGINVKSTYLGQDALRLAMISGNVSLVRFLIDLDIIDPYRVNKNEGNVLTFLLTDRFINVLPLDIIKKVIENVIDKNVSPLNALDEYVNAADFINTNIITKSPVKKGKQKPHITLVYTRSELEIVKKNIQIRKKLAEFVGMLSRRKILERLALVFTEVLIDFAEENLLEKDSIKSIALYVSPQNFLINLKILFNHGKIHEGRFKIRLFQDIINFLLENCKFPPVKSNKSVKTRQPKKAELASPDEFFRFIENMDFYKKKIVYGKYKLLSPGLDDPERYKVCIECFKPVTEFLCPVCQQIYFCSKKCFQNHQKRKSDKHLCQVNMFDNRIPSHENIGLMDLFNSSHESYKQKYVSNIPAKHDMKRKQSAVERKRESYGAKFSKTVKRPSLHGTKFTDTQIATPRSVVREEIFSKNGIRNKKKVILKQKTSIIHEKSSKESNNGKPRRKSKKDKSYNQDDVSDDTGETGEFGETDETERRDKRKHRVGSKKKSKKHEEEDSFSKPAGKLIGERIQDYNKNGNKHEKLGMIRDDVPNPLPMIGRKQDPLPGTSVLDSDIPKHVMGLEHLPSKPIYFLEVLSKLLPDVDLQKIMFPYICYADGHLYYSFKDSEFYCQNYSIN